MSMKIILLMTILVMLTSSVTAGTCTISGTESIDYTDGANITVTCATASVNESRCFSEGTEIGSESYPQDVGGGEATLTYSINLAPETTSQLTFGCQNNIDCGCYENVTGITLSEANDTCTATRICLWDFETSDIDDVIADNLGTAGIETRDNMPLIILGVVALLLTTIGTAIWYRSKKIGGQ